MAKAIMGTGASSGAREKIMIMTISSPMIFPNSLTDRLSTLEQ